MLDKGEQETSKGEHRYTNDTVPLDWYGLSFHTSSGTIGGFAHRSSLSAQKGPELVAMKTMNRIL